MESLDCVVVGDALVDIIVYVNKNCHTPATSQISHLNSAGIFCGGSGNIAVGISKLGGKAAFVGKVGSDMFGRFYLEDLRSEGVETVGFVDRQYSTGFVLVFVTDFRDRAFAVYRGASDYLSTTEILSKSVLEAVERSKYIYISGFSLVREPQRSSIENLLDLANDLKKKIMFDPGAHNLIALEPELHEGILRKCDIFSANFEEAAAICYSTKMNEIVDKLRRSTQISVVRLGSSGSLTITEEETFKTPAFKVQCKDPTGAGDAFASALIYGLSQEMPVKKIATLGNWLASKVVMKRGARSFPPKRKIRSFLNSLAAKNRGR